MPRRILCRDSGAYWQCRKHLVPRWNLLPPPWRYRWLPAWASLSDRLEFMGHGFFFCGDADANHVPYSRLSCLVLASLSPPILRFFPPCRFAAWLGAGACDVRAEEFASLKLSFCFRCTRRAGTQRLAPRELGNYLAGGQEPARK